LDTTCHGLRPAVIAVVMTLAMAGLPGCGSGDQESGAGTGSASGGDVGFGGGDIGESEDTPLFTEDQSAGSDDTGAIEPGTFGAPCKENEDCDTGLCIQTPDGRVCTKTCSEDCPEGFACVKNITGGDTYFMCVPRWLRLCDPCDTNEQCNESGASGNICVSFGKAGSYCGVKCEVDSDCPGGNYECSTVTDAATGKSSSQCTVKSGLCSCSKRASELGLNTTCLNTFQGSTCPGKRTCTKDGLSECDAAVPKLEECNGLDDDCDGKTDNFDQAAVPCKGKQNEFGQCPGVVKECIKGKVTCDAPAAQPEKCNGKDDDCDGETDEGLCEDGDNCTQDKCNTDGSCQHVKLAGMKCDDGSICTQTDKCLSGKCVGGNELDCDDQDSCTTDSCDPFSGCKHKPASNAVCPDDGNICTQDICKNGACVHPAVKEGSPCADDGKPCTQDTCKNKLCNHDPAVGKKCTDDGVPCTNDICDNQGACTHPVAQGKKCEDGNPCTINDKCVNGKCLAGGPKKCDDSNPCTKEACDPTKGGCVKTNNDYAPCVAPSSDCPVGVCWGGGCTSKPNEACSYSYKPGLCSSKVKINGVCSASGTCSPKSSPQQTTSCNGPCNGICVQCSIFKICIPF